MGTHSKLVLGPLFVVLLLLVACSDTDTAAEDLTEASEANTDNTAAGVVETGADSKPVLGRILVSSTAITGHRGHGLFVFGPTNESEVCATIDSDPWTLDATALTDRAADSNPCSGTLTDTLFEPGAHLVSASIFVPGSRTPSISTAATVEVIDGDAQLQIDGSSLSGTTTGDPGRILVTVSEITGQAGKIFMVIGPNNAGSLCAAIDSDSWTLPTPGALAELPGNDAGPCGDDTPDVLYAAGDTRVTAAVVVPGNSSADAMIELLVAVDGDVTAAIDGAQLSE